MALDPHCYTVVWFAPLEIEARAAACMLDHRHDGYFAVGPADDYVFQAGDICGYSIIIASFPAGQEYGTSAAAALASQAKTFFPNLYLGLLVGVAAGLPDLSRQPEHDIRLGDVLVALSVDDKPAVVAYDLGKQRANDDFTLLRSGYVLSNTKTVLRSAIGTLKAEEPYSIKSFLPLYHAIKDMQHATGTFVDPGQEHDHYFVDGAPVERRTRPTSQRTRVWYGAIGSGDTLMKASGKRDDLREKHGILGLEMEAAGIMNHIPVAVIRGVCDYGDENKNKDWQPYAAAMAAAYAKAVLQRIPPKSGTMGNPSPKEPVSVLSGSVRNEVAVPQDYRQSMLIRLIQRVAISPTTEWKHPLLNTPLKYLRAATSIPRGISSKIIIRDFLGRDLHFELPLDWSDLRVILLPYFDTPERHGFEKIRNEEFLIVHCERFKQINPSNWDMEAQHGRKFHMFAVINQLQLEYQMCISCQVRMKKFHTYLVCPDCGLFSLSAQHQQRKLSRMTFTVPSPPKPFESIARNSVRPRHPVGILSFGELLRRKSEIRKVAPVIGEIEQAGQSSRFHASFSIREFFSKWQRMYGNSRLTVSSGLLSVSGDKTPQEEDLGVQGLSTDDRRKTQNSEREELRHYKSIFIKEDASLYNAVIEENVETMKSILTRLQASQISVDATWGPLGTPLGAAILYRSDSSSSIIEALLRAGANPLLSSNPLGPPLSIAAALGNTNAVERMLGSILTNMNTTLDADIKHLQEVLNEALWRATYANHPNLMPLLLSAGANPFAATELEASAFPLDKSGDYRNIPRNCC